jgi:hypothetical protein
MIRAVVPEHAAKAAKLSMGVAVLAALAAIVVLVASPWNHGDRGPEVSAPRAFPAAERRLLSHVPLAVRHTCARARLDSSATPHDVVLCATPRSGGTFYAAFPDAVQMRSYLLSPRLGQTAPCLTGCCVDRWNVFSEVVRSRAPRADAYKCYSTSDGEYIEWTRDDLKIFAWMKVPKGQRRELLRAWRVAGPI